MKVIHGLLGFGIQKISSNLCINMKHDSTCVMAFTEYQANTPDYLARIQTLRRNLS